MFFLGVRKERSDYIRLRLIFDLQEDYHEQHRSTIPPNRKKVLRKYYICY